MMRAILFVILVLSNLGNCLAAGNKPNTVAELARYTGADRQKILEEGAKREGTFTFYTSAAAEVLSASQSAFQKKYPFIKNVNIWRSSSTPLMARATEEFKSGKHMMDVMEGSQSNMLVLQKVGIVQPFISPHLAQMEDEAKTLAPGGGVFAIAFRVSGIVFGYNTKLIHADQLPKNYQDLTDPKWKGKVAIAGSDAGVNWLSAIYRNQGMDLLKQIANQDFPVHMIAGQAMLDLIINGEVPASATIYDSNAYLAKQKGAPVGWIPLEPVPAILGEIAIAKNAPHPHTALLFADFEMSPENAEIYRWGGYGNFRKDFPDVEKRYKKYYGQDTVAAVREERDLFQKLFLKK